MKAYQMSTLSQQGNINVLFLPLLVEIHSLLYAVCCKQVIFLRQCAKVWNIWRKFHYNIMSMVLRPYLDHDPLDWLWLFVGGESIMGKGIY